MEPLLDAHNHLQDDVFQHSLDDIFATTDRYGIGRSIVNGTTEQDWPKVASLSLHFPDRVIPSFGLHPWHINQRSSNWLATLRSYLVQHPKSAVGECGLDRWIENHDLDDQLEVLLPQIELAGTLNRPLTIHCLKAWGPLLDCLKQVSLPSSGFLLHSYGGSREMIAPFIELGAYFSFSGHFLHSRKEKQCELFRHIPHDRLLIETDAPAMPLPSEQILEHFPNNQNHPANLRSIFDFFCNLLELPPTQTRQLLKKNEDHFLAPIK